LWRGEVCELGASTRLTVVHVVASLDVGGLERVVIDLATHADRRRTTPCVVCLDRPGAWASRLTGIGIPVDCVPEHGSWMPSRIIGLARLIRGLGADIVHLHNVKSHLHGALAARLAGVPVVVSTKHGRNYPTTPVARLTNRLACAICSDLIGVSTDCAAIWHQVEPARPEKVSVIVNGIDTAAFPYSTRPCGTPGRAVSVARLSAVKDPLTLLRATQRVIECEPDFQLDLVGDGPLRANVEAEIARLHLERAVRVHGTLDDVRAVLAGASFFVLSSTSEGVSMTLLEAMATGLPVVATNVGGTPEVVVDGTTGLLVPPREPKALADAMLWMSRHPEARQRMGVAARRRVEERFSMQHTIDAYERLYRRAIETHRRPRAAEPHAARGAL
jgi:glycosyltransferase involved in cell wall biosynthesis